MTLSFIFDQQKPKKQSYISDRLHASDIQTLVLTENELNRLAINLVYTDNNKKIMTTFIMGLKAVDYGASNQITRSKPTRKLMSKSTNRNSVLDSTVRLECGGCL